MKLTQTVMDEPARSPTPPPEADDQPPPLQSRRIEVELYDATGDLPRGDLVALTDLADRAMALLPNRGSVRVRLVDDAQMSLAHARYAGIEGTTDVLTFDLSHDPDPDADADPDAQPGKHYETKVLDADLTVCVDQARRQANQLGHPLLAELLLYIIHGTLHCLGHDDHDPDRYTAMHTQEDRMLKAVGVGATFFAQPQSRPQSRSQTQPHARPRSSQQPAPGSEPSS